MRSRTRCCARIISFSGVDGAGKSTQIDRLVRQLEALGLRVSIVRFWDDVAALKQLREEASHKIFKGGKGAGSPDAPVNRRDKNVRGWAMTGLRLFLYLLDVLSLRGVVKRARTKETDCVIFDRYIYDEIANLDLRHAMLGPYLRLLLSLAPKPDISFVLDADPNAARARKPEYPLEFIRFNRENYLALARRLEWLTVIQPLGVESVHQKVLALSEGLLRSSVALKTASSF